MSNAFMVLDSAREDKRCEKCKHHRFVVLSYHESGVWALHTRAHMVRGQEWPYLASDQALHWWGNVFGATEQDKLPPTCLGSYKKVGGK